MPARYVETLTQASNGEQCYHDHQAGVRLGKDRSANAAFNAIALMSRSLVVAAEHICDLAGALYHAQLKRPFMNDHTPPSRLLYDRALLLHGPKRSEILTLDEVRQYGTDSFSDVDYLSIYGLKPAEWYARGIRLLGRTAVECTRDLLADRIGRDIAELTASLPKLTSVTVFDPFAGSCNTLYWILRHVPSSEGLAFEFDPQVFEVTNRNISGLDRRIALRHGDFLPTSRASTCRQGTRWSCLWRRRGVGRSTKSGVSTCGAPSRQLPSS